MIMYRIFLYDDETKESGAKTELTFNPLLSERAVVARAKDIAKWIKNPKITITVEIRDYDFDKEVWSSK